MVCKFLRRGNVAPLQPIDALRIYICTKEAGASAPSIGGQIEYLPAREKKSGRRFLVLYVRNLLEAVDFDLADVEPWPPGTELEPWDDPRGQTFIKPALRRAAIPDDVHIFRLSDWPSGPHTVVSGRGKGELEGWAPLSREWIFKPLVTD
jgi:hypothetical protein